MFAKTIFMIVMFIPSMGAANAGLLEVDRVWIEGDFGHALVTYTNDTGTTYGISVTIKCIAIGADNKKINLNTRSFFAHVYGPIAPGFSDSLEIPVRLNGLSMKSMSCSARER